MTYLEIALAALIAGTLDTVAGFGGVLLLLPILVIVAGSRDAVMLSALIPLSWNLARVVILRPYVRWMPTALFALGILPGALLGAWYFAGVDPDTLRVAIGALLILFGIYYVVRLYVDLPQMRSLASWWYPIAGLVSGAIGAILGAGHGPLQTWTLAAGGLGPREIVATNGALGAITAIARLIGYAVSGTWNDTIWLPAGIGIAAGVAGALIGIRVSRRAKDSTLELIIGVALVLAGISLSV